MCGRTISRTRNLHGTIRRLIKESGAWPLASLRQSFLNGSLTRLVDPDGTLKAKIVEFVSRGDFGLASGKRPDGTFDRLWFQESVASDEVAFEVGVFLLRKTTAEALKAGVPSVPPAAPELAPEPVVSPGLEQTPATGSEPAGSPGTRTLRLTGSVPPEVWNRLGTKILSKLRGGTDLKIGVDFSVMISEDQAGALAAELRQVLAELGLERLSESSDYRGQFRRNPKLISFESLQIAYVMAVRAMAAAERAKLSLRGG